MGSVGKCDQVFSVHNVMDIVQDIPDVQIVQRNINIDSRDRDKSVYTNTNDYVINLKDALYGVKRIELVSAEIPKSEYFVDDTNNLLEMLIDPVLFANRAPTGYRERLIANHHGGNNITVTRVDSSQSNANGVIDFLRAGSSQIERVVSSVFNASRTSYIDTMEMSRSEQEVLFVTSYSEDEDNFSGNCRFMILRYGDTLNRASFSFGSEFSFEVLNNVPTSVYDKRMCSLGDNKFALVYNKNNASVNLRVGSVGTNVHDLDGRVSNSDLVKSTVSAYSSCRIDDTKSFVVFCADNRLSCKVVSIDSDFALYFTEELEIDETESLNLSCDCMNDRVLVSSVDIDGTLKVYMMIVVEGPDLLLMTSTRYSLESANSSLNASSSESFRVDPNSVIKWTSDVFSVTTMQVRRVGSNVVISTIQSSNLYPSLELEKNEYHRIAFVAHPLDPDVPVSILESVKIYTSQTQNIEYVNVKKHGTSMILFANVVNTLFYGIEGQSTRGVINFNGLNPDHVIPFNVFVSGVHDVGNKPFSFKSSRHHIRSFREDFMSPGGNQGSSGCIVDVSGTGFLFHENSEIWCFRDGVWSFTSAGGVGNNHHPGPREGAMVTNVGKNVYLFGGISTERSNAATLATPNYSLRPLSSSSYVLKNVKNSKNHSIVYYDVVTPSNRTSFTSLVDPGAAQISTGWSGLVDVSSFFDRTTSGFFVSSFAPASVSYVHDIDTSVGTWGDGPNPTGYVYNFEMQMYPYFESVDTSGMLEIVDDVHIRVEIFDGVVSKESSNFVIAPNSWSNISLKLNTVSWESDNLQNMSLVVTCSNVFMKQGFCAVRDPELFVLDYELAVGVVEVELYFSSTKHDPETSTFQLESHPFEVEEKLMNDLWSIVVDPYFSQMTFSLKRSDEEDRILDRCTKISPVLVPVGISGFVPASSTAAVNVSEGLQLFSDGPSCMFGGNTVLSMPSTGDMIRENTTGDFTFSCTIAPRLCKSILSIDHSSTSLVVYGHQPYSYTTVNVSNDLPSVYRSGKSLIFDQSTLIDFNVLLPGQFIVSGFFFIPSSSSGTISIFKVGNLQLVASDDGELRVHGMSISFPRNQWIHVSWMANGMAMRLTVDDVSVSALVARDTVASFQVGGGGWNGTILSTGINVCTVFGNKGLDYLTLLSDDHRNGHQVTDFYTIMSCGVNNSDLRLFIDCTGTEPLLVASLLNKSTHQTLPDGSVDVCIGREHGTLHLFTGSTRSSVSASVSTSLLTGDFRIGGRQGFNSAIYQSYCGAVDEMKLLIGHFDSDSIVHVLDADGLRVRSMTWRLLNYVSDPMVASRAYGSMTVDSALPPNLWLFGGEGVNGSMNDLWQITTGGVMQAYNVNGSPLSTGKIESSMPGSRSRFAHYNDGEYLYVFGGETGPSVGPFQLNGTVMKLYNQTGSGTPSTPFWQASSPVSGLLYPVYTRNTAVLLDASDVVWAEVSDGTNTFYVFLFPEENQSNLGVNAFLRTSSTSMPDLIYSEHVHNTSKFALSDFWKYSINTASWVLLNEGSELRSLSSPSPSPGVRSRCSIHYDAAQSMFYLLPGQSSLSGVFQGQDLWSIGSVQEWEWKLIRVYSDTSTVNARDEFSHECQPGSTPVLYWKDQNNMPSMWASSGYVFTNQLMGELPEANLHHCIAISSEFQNNVSEGAKIEFMRRTTLDASTVYPGTLKVESLSAMGDGCYLVTTSKFIFAELSLPETSISSYDPTQLPDGAMEIVQTLPTQPPGEPFILIRGVKYEFRTVQPDQVDISTISELQGVSVVASEDFTITAGSLQLPFTVVSFSAHEYVVNYTEPVRQIGLQALHDTHISDVIGSSAFSTHTTSIVESTYLNLRFRVSFQNQTNSRYGEVTTISLDRTSGNFSFVNTNVFSSSNPTTNIMTASALFNQTIILYSNENGINSVMCDDTTVSPSTLQSSVSGSNVSICVLNSFEMNASNTEWMVFFVYNNNLRVCAQKSISKHLDAPVQNLVGETIRYSDAIVLDSVNSGSVRLCVLESGELKGEVVAIYSSAKELFFKDAVVSSCDPLNTSVAPTIATKTFSLVTRVNLVSVDASDFEVISLSSIGDTNFVVIFLSENRRTLSYKLFVREAGAYLSEETLLFTFTNLAHFVKVDKLGSTDTYHLHFIVNDEIKVLHTTWMIDSVDPLQSELRVVSTILQSIDNTDSIQRASSVFTSDQIVTFSVHENSNTQVCPITARVIKDQADVLTDWSGNDVIEQEIRRQSFTTRIRSGDYNQVTSFVQEIKSNLLKIDPNFDCVYDDATTKISIINEFSTFTILLSNTRFDIEDESASNGLGYILGFRDFKDVVSSFDGSIYRADSTNRIDLFGRQYLYLFLYSPDGAISSEATSRNKENAFGRIILSVNKGETMFFTSSMYEVFADVSIPVITQLRVKLVRFAQINSSISDGRDLFLYQPQGMEHSFSLKIHCALDKVGSGRSNTTVVKLPVFDNFSSDEEETDDENDYFG